MRFAPIFSFAIFSVWATIPAYAEPLEAGFATADITPPVGYRMSGYFNERPSTGVRDPLLARVIVLRQGDVQAALVFCDLIGISLSVAGAVRQRAEEQLGIPAAHVAISATHSHTGPLYFGELREYFHALAVAEHGSDPREEFDYAAALVDKLSAALAEAQSALAPVELAAGIAREDRLSFNRRFHMRDGTVRFNPGQQNPDIVRVAGPIDPEVGLLRFTPVGGKAPSAALAAFALHLDTVGGTEYSGDYPAVLQNRLREVFGGEFLSLFGAGTCGDINHVDVSIQGRRSTEEIGTMLAETVAAALPRLAPVESPSLAVRSRRVDYPKQVYTPAQIEAARQAMVDVANPQGGQDGGSAGRRQGRAAGGRRTGGRGASRGDCAGVACKLRNRPVLFAVGSPGRAGSANSATWRRSQVPIGCPGGKRPRSVCCSKQWQARLRPGNKVMDFIGRTGLWSRFRTR